MLSFLQESGLFHHYLGKVNGHVIHVLEMEKKPRNRQFSNPRQLHHEASFLALSSASALLANLFEASQSN